MAGTKFHIVSFFALFALLVAPLAWQQTRVQRVELPVDRIRALSWNASRFAQPERHVVRIFYIGSVLPSAPLRSRSPRVEYTTTALPLSTEQKRALAQLPAQRLDDALLEILPQSDLAAFSLVVLCTDSASSTTAAETAITVGKHRHAWFHGCSPSEDALSELSQNHVFPEEQLQQQTSDGRARIAVKYRLQFALLKERGDASWTWDFKQLQQRFLTPALDKLSSVAQFTVDHQTLHYARLAKEIHADPSGRFHYVLADDLKHFKSTNDFLTSSVLADREQVLHFMAALPSEEHSPLIIKPQHDGHMASAFAIPTWGIVAIVDPHKLNASDSEEAQVQRLMGLFLSQLRALLGLPSFTQRHAIATNNLTFLPSPVDGVAQWELDVVVRRLLRRHVRSSVETLHSIAQLVSDMPQMSVLDRVAHRITHALDVVERILCVSSSSSSSPSPPSSSSDDVHCESLLDASSAAQLLVRAREAVEEADAAYYDHTMIRQLYFPQEQMLGVFAPLLAPLLLPFVVGWFRELKRLRAKRKAKNAKTIATSESTST